MQGTLARELLSSPKEVLSSDGRLLKVKCAVSSFSFSAHADYSQTSHFIETLAPAHVVLCHGNTNEMDRLKKALEKQAKDGGADRLIHAPAVRLDPPLLLLGFVFGLNCCRIRVSFLSADKLETLLFTSNL